MFKLYNGELKVFVESETRSEQVSSGTGTACHKIVRVRRATAKGILLLQALLSTTYHQGPTGMARLGRSRRGRQPTRRPGQATQSTLRERGKMPARVLGVPPVLSRFSISALLSASSSHHLLCSRQRVGWCTCVVALRSAFAVSLLTVSNERRWRNLARHRLPVTHILPTTLCCDGRVPAALCVCQPSRYTL